MDALVDEGLGNNTELPQTFTLPGPPREVRWLTSTHLRLVYMGHETLGSLLYPALETHADAPKVLRTPTKAQALEGLRLNAHSITLCNAVGIQPPHDAHKVLRNEDTSGPLQGSE